MNNQIQKYVLFGAGGHGAVVAALLRACGHTIAGVADPAMMAAGQDTWQGVPVIGDDDVRDRFDPRSFCAAIGVGMLPDQTNVRKKLFSVAKAAGYVVPALTHPAACVDPGVAVAEGAQVMAGATVQVGVKIGINAIINTGAIVDHDSIVGDQAHVAPGAVLCGDVVVGDGAFIGARACVIQSVQVGDGAVVGAGCTLRRSLAAKARYVGK